MQSHLWGWCKGRGCLHLDGGYNLFIGGGTEDMATCIGEGKGGEGREGDKHTE